ncbi:MAG: hypothetical protein GKR88_09925 [Flavobacteriaceae bacterium]|nr:MAG: hypothetical protein GKR88_09925 [Flavobacteriaceae bacterium]
MDLMFDYLKNEIKEIISIKCIKQDINKLTIKSNYYYFNLKKQESNYIFSYNWNFGILGKFIFNKKFNNMLEILKIIKDYSDENNIILSTIYKSKK